MSAAFDGRVRALMDRLRDERSRRVVFLSHCLLNENTRYLGGACRRGCVRELVQQCLDADIGIVQMPCPEEQAWGGVPKRRMLRIYGSARGSAGLGGVEGRLLPAGMLYTRLVYRRLARKIAAQIADYVTSGFTVVGVIGVDASPSCGVTQTIDVAGAVSAMARFDPTEITRDEQNDLVRENARPGRGIFIEELEAELSRRRLNVPVIGHDLQGELEGKPSNVKLPTR